MMEIIKMVKNKVKALMSDLMDLNIQAIGRIIKYVDMVNISCVKNVSYIYE
jgi:hypothetical protein